jgi:hypothetical protein
MNEVHVSRNAKGCITANNGRVRHAMMTDADMRTSKGITSAVLSGLAGAKLIARPLDSSVCERSSTELRATSRKQHPVDRRCRSGFAYGLNLMQHQTAAGIASYSGRAYSKSKARITKHTSHARMPRINGAFRPMV